MNQIRSLRRSLRIRSSRNSVRFNQNALSRVVVNCQFVNSTNLYPSCRVKSSMKRGFVKRKLINSYSAIAQLMKRRTRVIACCRRENQFRYKFAVMIQSVSRIRLTSPSRTIVLVARQKRNKTTKLSQRRRRGHEIAAFNSSLLRYFFLFLCTVNSLGKYRVSQCHSTPKSVSRYSLPGYRVSFKYVSVVSGSVIIA